jgi:S-formylglutathione hydrolase FrmB
MKVILPLIALLLIGFASKAQQYGITVQLDTSVKKPLTGRLYVFSTRDTARGVQDPDPFNPTPTFLVDVENWKGGEIKLIDSSTSAFPVKLNHIKPGYYKFAAVLDIDTEERSNTITPGNYYSRDVMIQIKNNEPINIRLHLNRSIPQRPFRETEQIKFVQLKSELVSAFRRKDSYIKAGIILPKSYQMNASKNYPVVFVIPGWGGTQYDVYNPGAAKRYGFSTGKEKIFVYLNPETNNPFGLHAFIDSRVNGPWGKTLVEELIPWLKKNYRISDQYFVAGQSSGGYAALWLQLHYPAVFLACWAVSPDPVDFSNFTGINLYAKKANMYYDTDGRERGMSLMNGQYQSTVKNYAQFENWLGNGGQMQSFEAAFGLLNQKTKKPKELFDRQTGIIDKQVVKSWKVYDLSTFLEANYNKISSQLSNKIFVYAGADDNFLLNRSVEAFRTKVIKINAKATVEIIPGVNHWSIWTEAFTQKMHMEMDARIL